MSGEGNSFVKTPIAYYGRARAGFVEDAHTATPMNGTKIVLFLSMPFLMLP